MLQEKKIKEFYKIIENKVFAVYEETGQKRNLDGCEVRKQINNVLSLLKEEKERVEAYLKQIIEKETELTQLDGQLIALGFCKIDSPFYKRVGGVVINENGQPVVEKFIHQQSCKNRGK